MSSGFLPGGVPLPAHAQSTSAPLPPGGAAAQPTASFPANATGTAPVSTAPVAPVPLVPGVLRPPSPAVPRPGMAVGGSPLPAPMIGGAPAFPGPRATGLFPAPANLAGTVAGVAVPGVAPVAAPSVGPPHALPLLPAAPVPGGFPHPFAGAGAPAGPISPMQALPPGAVPNPALAGLLGGLAGAAGLPQGAGAGLPLVQTPGAGFPLVAQGVGLPPGAVAGFPPGAVAGFPPGAVAGFPPGAVAGFPPGAVAGLPPGAAFPPGAGAGFPPGAVAGFPPGAVAGPRLAGPAGAPAAAGAPIPPQLVMQLLQSPLVRAAVGTGIDPLLARPDTGQLVVRLGAWVLSTPEGQRVLQDFFAGRLGHDVMARLFGARLRTMLEMHALLLPM